MEHCSTKLISSRASDATVPSIDFHFPKKVQMKNIFFCFTNFQQKLKSFIIQSFYWFSFLVEGPDEKYLLLFYRFPGRIKKLRKSEFYVKNLEQLLRNTERIFEGSPLPFSVISLLAPRLMKKVVCSVNSCSFGIYRHD